MFLYRPAPCADSRAVTSNHARLRLRSPRGLATRWLLLPANMPDAAVALWSGGTPAIPFQSPPPHPHTSCTTPALYLLRRRPRCRRALLPAAWYTLKTNGSDC
jgi:hypothetical protein